MNVGDKKWASERLYAVLTPGGAIAKRPGSAAGRLLIFTTFEDAAGWLRPGYSVAGFDLPRVVVLHVQEAA